MRGHNAMKAATATDAAAPKPEDVNVQANRIDNHVRNEVLFIWFEQEERCITILSEPSWILSAEIYDLALGQAQFVQIVW